MIESKVLSSNGRALVKDLIIPPYPEMLHALGLEEEMVAQLKVNGYNVRLIKVDNLLIPLLRGGALDKKTFELIQSHLAQEFDSFFEENPKKVLCLEIIGKKTMANHKGDKDIDYFIFDIMDLEKEEEERFLPFSQVSGLCQKHRLNLIGSLGQFNSFPDLNKKLLIIPPIYEGVVLKSLDGKRIVKYKWEDNSELFKAKIPPKEEKTFVESEEARTVAHFFQGYGEKELGLEKGLTQEELKEYERLVERLGFVERDKLGEEVNQIVSFLMEKIKEKGAFSEEMKKKIEKEFKVKVGKEVGKLLRRTKGSSP